MAAHTFFSLFNRHKRSNVPNVIPRMFIYVYFFFYFSDSPKFVSSPQSYSGNTGAPHNFTCTATGHPVPKITWMFSSVSLIMKL